jgi:hypothetical protein
MVTEKAYAELAWSKALVTVDSTGSWLQVEA